MKLYETIIKLKDVIENIFSSAIKTNAIVTTANQSPVVSQTVETPDFEKMTKAEIDEWATSNLGIYLDRRFTKVKMIAELKKHL